MSSMLKNTSPANFIITQNKQMLSILQDVKSAVEARMPLFITGEEGTGKELMADYIHVFSGLQGSLVKINILDLNDEDLFPATLFGYAKGAFAGSDESHSGMIERAAGGVLYLDEISELNPASQVRLYKLIESGEYPSGEG